MSHVYIRDRLLTTSCVYRAVPLSSDGLMAAGTPTDIKYRYPDFYSFYQNACLSGNVKPGQLLEYTHQYNEILLGLVTRQNYLDPHSRQALSSCIESLTDYFHKLTTEQLSLAIMDMRYLDGPISTTEADDLLAPLTTVPYLTVYVYSK